MYTTSIRASKAGIMNDKLLIVEGVSNSGKTTLCRKLHSEFGFKVIDEGIRYLEEERGLPRTEFIGVPSSLKEERANQDMLFHAERHRVRDAIAYLRSGHSVVLDKSAIAILASAYAFANIPEKFGDIIYAMNGLTSIRDYLLKECPSIDIIFAVIQAPFEVRSERNRRRQSYLEDIWVDEDTAVMQECFLEAFLKLSGMKWRVFDGTASNLSDKVYEFYEEA